MPDEQTTQALESLARHVRSARHAAGMPIEGEHGAATAANMSPVTWRQVEKGMPVTDLTYSRVERVLGWQQGSVEAILAGGEPQPRNPLPDAATLAEVTFRQIEEVLDMDGLTSRMREDTIRGIMVRYRRQVEREAPRPEDEPGRQSDTG